MRSVPVVLTISLLMLATGASAASAEPTLAPDLGANVVVFDPSMAVSDIQARADAIYAQQVDDEMGTNRYALLFKPGTYGTDATPLQLKVGYYTEVAGLGAAPSDVVINGKIEVYNRCLKNEDGTPNCIALVNFWRTLANLTIHVNSAGQDGCRSTANFWAVSQAVSMRRVIVDGPMSLMDYCTAGPQYASGGFIADSRTGSVVNGSQQQWLTRDSEIGPWSNGVWNQVFAGVVGAPSDAAFPDPPYTTLDTNPVSREKPYLFLDEHGRYAVRVPSPRTDSRGPTWTAGLTPGRTVPLSDFAIVRPSDSVLSINVRLATGRNLLLLPGVYNVAQSIAVRRANTVVLGLGHPTLTAQSGAIPLTISDVPGVVVAGVTIDAGPVNSPVLLQVGQRRSQRSDPANPTLLADVYFRIGGPHVGQADVTLEVNSDNVLIDNLWAWRADHGVPGSVGWNVNRARSGVVVNGDHVTATGLFVEHYQQYNVVWNGEDGRTVFFQNELPYDAPNQAAWQHDGIPGWAAYKVDDRVRGHQLWGGGSYIFTNVDPSIHAARGFEVPVRDGVRLHHVLTVNLSAGTIDHVVNDTGAPVDNSNTGKPSFVAEFPA